MDKLIQVDARIVKLFFKIMGCCATFGFGAMFQRLLNKSLDEIGLVILLMGFAGTLCFILNEYSMLFPPEEKKEQEQKNEN